MTSTFDVRSVPIPPRSKYPWKTIDVSDSFFVPVSGDKERFLRQMRIQSIRAGKKYSRRFVTRTVNEQGQEGIRIWRTA